MSAQVIVECVCDICGWADFHHGANKQLALKKLGFHKSKDRDVCAICWQEGAHEDTND